MDDRRQPAPQGQPRPASPGRSVLSRAVQPSRPVLTSASQLVRLFGGFPPPLPRPDTASITPLERYLLPVKKTAAPFVNVSPDGTFTIGVEDRVRSESIRVDAIGALDILWKLKRAILRYEVKDESLCQR